MLTYEKLLDEHGREMHRSWGNAISADEALDEMGADVMRWLYCEANPGQNIKFGYGPAREVSSSPLIPDEWLDALRELVGPAP